MGDVARAVPLGKWRPPASPGGATDRHPSQSHALAGAACYSQLPHADGGQTGGGRFCQLLKMFELKGRTRTSGHRGLSREDWARGGFTTKATPVFENISSLPRKTL